MLAALMQRVQRGEEAAFREIYDLTHERVAQVVTGTVRSPEHSAEVVQEVFLHVWQNAAAFDESRGAVLGWLLLLARGRAVDRVRHVVRAIRRDHRSAATADLTTPDVAEIGLALQEAAQVRGAVRRLCPRQRNAVALTFLDGYSHQQAADLLGIPLGTLKTRVRTGVISLRRDFDARAA